MYTNTVSTELLDVIKRTAKFPSLSHFRLCGGTALSLQIGHRISVDADFVTDNIGDKDQLQKYIMELFPDATDFHHGAFGFYLKINGIKVDFLCWNLPFIRNAIVEDGISFTNIEEIIAMKLFAILQRGEKKDYMDIATLLSQYSLTQMVSFFNERHRGYDAATILRFLASYSDIERQPEPIMLNGLTWEESKLRINKAIVSFL